jgi:hypothetical protein
LSSPTTRPHHRALRAAGGDLCRRGDRPGSPRRWLSCASRPAATCAGAATGPAARADGFRALRRLIVEVAQAGGRACFWGLTVTVRDVDALAGPLVGAARAAVQPGRRIATAARAAGLSVAVAFISPRAGFEPDRR